MQDYQHLLAPIDFSEMTEAVVQRAKNLAEIYDARLTLLHIVPDIPIGAEPFGEPSSIILGEELHEERLNTANVRMQELAQQFDLPLSVERAVREGLITDTILEFCEEKDIDLVVIAHSGKKSFLGLLGSTADAVVKSAKCDVMVIRADE